MKKKVTVKPSLLEEARHFDYAYPLYTDVARLGDYEQLSFACHWHTELEFTVVLEGRMEYCIDDTVFVAEAGTGMMVNANVLHTARSLDGGDCTYLVVILDPVLIYGHENSAMRRYVDEILHTPELGAVRFSGAVPWEREIMELLRQAAELDRDRPPCFELEVKARLCRMWSLLYQNTVAALPAVSRPIPSSISHLKQSLDFIHSHYPEKIGLPQIARAGNISPGECCRIFKKTLRQSPIQYLLAHRIRKSLFLLQEDGPNITEIAGAVGFSSASYFTEVFRARMNTTPREYRAALRKEAVPHAV